MTDKLNRLRPWLLENHGDTLDADRLTVMEAEMKRLATGHIDGDVVELGCYKGAMALWMRACLDAHGSHRTRVHVFDSFEGLPAAGPHDPELFPTGFLLSSPQDVIDLHQQWSMIAPVIHPGWFEQTLPTELPPKIAFAYLDGDYHDSILASLIATVPRLTTGAALIVDDYADTAANPAAWDGLPGVKTACDTYFGIPSPLTVMFGEGDLAFGRYEAHPGEAS